MFENSFLRYLQEAPVVPYLPKNGGGCLLFLQQDLEEGTWPVLMLMKVRMRMLKSHDKEQRREKQKYQILSWVVWLALGTGYRSFIP